MRSRTSLRRTLVTAVAVAALAVTTAAAVHAATKPAPALHPAAVASDQYSWKNVAIGGGGFVPGIIFNQGKAGLVYARTDIGGAYRFDTTTSRWVPLLDWVGFANWGYNGAASLATDPVDPNRLYVAAGMYTNSWDPNNGGILRSTDQGRTWAVTPLPFKLGGNMPGRGMGERLAIDPNNDKVLYLGAPSGHGLWRSTDYGVTWSQVTNFPNVGNYAPDPTDTTGYQSDNEGVTWVVFDRSTASAGGTTQGIYVGVADKQNTVYRSTDGGATWTRIAGQPTGYLAHKGVVDPVNHLLYLATSDTGGPYDGAKGDVWKYTITTGAWTQISPVLSSDSNDYYGYSGLTIDRQHPGTIMVATQVSWWPDIIIFRSTDAGATWTRIWDWTSYPDRSLRYTQDISSVPWLTFGTAAAPPVPSPKLGWMTESMEIDPFDSNHLLYGTGATIYQTTNLTTWDSGGTISIKPDVAGLEETAALDLISPPSGAHLLTALGDIGGFRHDNLDQVPAMMYTQPTLTTTRSIDYAELSPSTIVRAGDIDKSSNPNVNRAGFSTDGGSNWFQASSEPSGVTAGGTIAEAADASATVWAATGAPVSYSTTYGSSWTPSTGIPTGAQVRSDRVNGKKFYGFLNGTFYVSTNGGASFAATAATGLPATGTVNVHAVPGHEGDIWLAGGTGSSYGLWHSTNSGASFTKLANVDQADNVGFGAAAPGASYPALYVVAQVSGVRGVFRSDDGGASWVRINDDAHQYGNIGAAITGDPRVYGRVYLATNGRGVLYADRTGGTTSSPTASPTSASPSPSPTSPSPSPTATGTGTCTVKYTVVNQWPGGFQGDALITNKGGAAVNGWSLTWSFPNGQVISSLWNGSYTQSGAAVTVTNASWNGTIAPGGTADVGFQASWNNTTNAVPTAFTLNGTACGAG